MGPSIASDWHLADTQVSGWVSGCHLPPAPSGDVDDVQMLELASHCVVRVDAACTELWRVPPSGETIHSVLW